MDREQRQKDFFSQWFEFQRSFLSQWTDSFGKTPQPWTDSLGFWQGAMTPYADMFSAWSKMIQETIGTTAGQADEGLGRTVLYRTLGASNVFMVLNEFWLQVLGSLPELYQAKGDAAKSREIFERWVQRYNKVFEQVVGSPVSGSAQEAMTSWLNTVQMQQTAMGLVGNPWIQAMPQWREQAERIMKGDWTALTEARSLWREVYDDTLGRVLAAPAFGLTKEQTERLRRTYDAFVRFWASLPVFYQLFQRTGMDALKEVFDKVQDLKVDEMRPETLREAYVIWWTANENAFLELFKSPDFGNAMAEVLHQGLLLRKRLDELTAEWCKVLSIPSNRDFDEVAMAIHELRRRVRQQQTTIEELQRKLDQVA
jgi:hypothetical protein